VRLAFAGTPAVALPSLDALLGAERHDVVAVITRPDAPAGRGRVLTASPVKERAVDAGVEVLTPAKPSEPEFLDRLRGMQLDCIAVVAYGALVPPAALEIPAFGWVNLHFSLLPAWRGAAPVQHAIIAGDDITGATTFELEPGLDTGPVYGVMTEMIGPRDTAGELLDRLATGGAGLLLATMDGIADGALVAEPQLTDGVTLAPKLTTADAAVDWQKPAVGVDRQVRGCTPAPGAWTTFRERRLGLGPVLPLATDEDLSPGELRDQGREGVVVGTSTGAVRLTTVRPEGKPERTAEEWARGARLETGETLG
jgi:methionyl-tRNA formyltransferase